MRWLRWKTGLWWLGAALAVAAGVGIALWRAPQTVTVPLERQAAPPPDRAPASRPPPMPAPPLLAQEAPPGLDAAQWRSLQRELAGRPDELRRVVASLVYADTMQRFRATRDAALARELDQGLEERLRQREMSANEARLVKLALLEVLLPDEAGRRAALAAWDATHAAPARSASARDAEFQRRQAELVAAWQATPNRDPQQLERQLDALRQAHFGASPGAATP